MAEHKRHQGHRQRMRERVQNYGLDSLAEHEALEYVLYLTNAQKDTNGIAHDLIDRFGDFAAVLEASEEELCTVEGVGPATARTRCSPASAPSTLRRTAALRFSEKIFSPSVTASTPKSVFAAAL